MPRSKKWREKYDRAKDKIRAINDFAFIEKKLKQFREQETKIDFSTNKRI